MRAGPIATSAAAALLFTAACPPYAWWPAAWIVPGLLLVPIRGLRPATAASCGALFGTLWGCTMAGWMHHAALSYFELDATMALAFVLGVAVAYAGIPNALLAASYAWLAPRFSGTGRALLGAWLWACSELFRAHVFTGLPWELLGHTQVAQLRLIQIVDLGGAYAVSFVIAFTSISVGELLAGGWQRRRALRASALLRPLAPAAALLAVVGLYGSWALDTYARGTGDAPRSVTVVQGNVPNRLRWKREFFDRVLLTYARLSPARADAATDLVVWPENAVNFHVNGAPTLRPILTRVASAAREGLLLGGPRRGETGESHNSAHLLGPDGTDRGAYDKQHLLPFAEYDPLARRTAGPLAGPLDFAPGSRGGLLQTATLRIGALICYEILFPGLVRDRVRRGADVLVNIANDSWLDDGAGAAPDQHFSMVPFAAIATRRYLVRASASGVSGFVDPTGAVYSLLPRATSGASTASVTPRTDVTTYVRWGDGWILAGVLPLGVALVRRHAAGGHA